MANVKAHEALKRMRIVRMTMKITNMDEKLVVQMNKLNDKLDSMNFAQLCHEERLLNHLLVLLDSGLDLYKYERKAS